MLKYLSILLAGLPTVAGAQAISPGRWDVTSTAVDLDIPGAPKFVLRMMQGKSKTERKCVTPDQSRSGIAALLVPDPKAKCRVDSTQVDNGRYSQVLSCPQNKGTPVQISRNGTYDGAGFAGRLYMAGTTAKGPMRIVLDQKAVRAGATCGG